MINVILYDHGAPLDPLKVDFNVEPIEFHRVALHAIGLLPKASGTLEDADAEKDEAVDLFLDATHPINTLYDIGAP